jgi:excisionase family DNA binding protein
MSAGRFLSPEQIADELGVSLDTVYRRIEEMHPVRVGSAIRVERVQFENWIRRNQGTKKKWHASSDAGTARSGTRGSRQAREARGSSAPSAPIDELQRSKPDDSNGSQSIPLVKRRRRRPSPTP